MARGTASLVAIRSQTREICGFENKKTNFPPGCVTVRFVILKTPHALVPLVRRYEAGGRIAAHRLDFAVALGQIFEVASYRAQSSDRTAIGQFSMRGWTVRVPLYVLVQTACD